MERLEGYEAVMQELIRGNESASRLKVILSDQLSSSVTGGGTGRDEQVEALMEQISGSFARSISFLMSLSSKINVEQRSCPSFNGAPPQQEEHKAVKISDCLTNWNNIAGSRRREYPGAQKFILSALPEDGHCWKKYGQKNILGAKHPRSYFRCSQKKDQGCQAIKQVQMTEDDPPKYLVTYVGLHTCSAAILYSDLQPMDQTTGNNQCFLNFESANHHRPNSQEQAALYDQVFSVHPAFGTALADADDSGISAMAISDDGAAYRTPSSGAAAANMEGRGVFSPAASTHARDEMESIAVLFLDSDVGGVFRDCKEEMD